MTDPTGEDDLNARHNEKKPERGLLIVVTGRNAKPEMIELAELVTEMTFVKHPFRGGVKAQRGIEF